MFHNGIQRLSAIDSRGIAESVGRRLTEGVMLRCNVAVAQDRIKDGHQGPS